MVFDANGSFVEKDDWRVLQMAFLVYRKSNQASI